jgi:hypothetical protein
VSRTVTLVLAFLVLGAIASGCGSHQNQSETIESLDPGQVEMSGQAIVTEPDGSVRRLPPRQAGTEAQPQVADTPAVPIAGELPPDTPEAPSISVSLDPKNISVEYSLAEDPHSYALLLTASATSRQDTGTQRTIRNPPLHGRVTLPLPPGTGPYDVSATSYSQHGSSRGPVVLTLSS